MIWRVFRFFFNFGNFASSRFATFSHILNNFNSDLFIRTFKLFMNLKFILRRHIWVISRFLKLLLGGKHTREFWHLYDQNCCVIASFFLTWLLFMTRRAGGSESSFHRWIIQICLFAKALCISTRVWIRGLCLGGAVDAVQQEEMQMGEFKSISFTNLKYLSLRGDVYRVVEVNQQIRFVQEEAVPRSLAQPALLSNCLSKFVFIWKNKILRLGRNRNRPFYQKLKIVKGFLPCLGNVGVDILLICRAVLTCSFQLNPPSCCRCRQAKKT